MQNSSRASVITLGQRSDEPAGGADTSPRTWRGAGGSQGPVPGDEDAAIGLAELWALARRRWWIVALVSALGALVALLYIQRAEPIYRTSASLVIDARTVNALENQTDLMQFISDDRSVMTQVELLESDKVIERVVEDLDLVNDQRFLADLRSGGGLRSRIRGALVGIGLLSGGDGGNGDARREAIDGLRSRMDIRREPSTYVITVFYQSHFPDLAARVANSLVAAYLDEQLDARIAASRRTDAFLTERLADLRTRAEEIDDDARRFRQQNAVLESDGQLLSEQRLRELNVALAEARAELAEAQALHQRATLASSVGDKVAIEDNPLFDAIPLDLRERYFSLTELRDDYAARLPDGHPTLAKLDAELEQLSRRMRLQIVQIRNAALNVLEEARAKVAELDASVRESVEIAASETLTLGELNELEEQANALRDAYRASLVEYQDKTKEFLFPVAEGRVIKTAEAPRDASWPRKPMILLQGILAGIVLGGLVAGLLELLDRGMRRRATLVSAIGADLLAYVPRLRGPRGARLSDRVRHVLEEPRSPFAGVVAKLGEVAMLHAERSAERPYVLGITSTVDGEGKTTLAANLAFWLARSGVATMLVDGDVGARDLSQALSKTRPMPDSGSEVWSLVDGEEGGPRLALLPPMSAPPRVRDALRALWQDEGDRTEVIVVDMPSMADGAATIALLREVDAYLYLSAWGRTTAAAARHGSEEAQSFNPRCLGGVFTFTDLKRLGRYETNEGAALLSAGT